MMCIFVLIQEFYKLIQTHFDLTKREEEKLYVFVIRLKNIICKMRLAFKSLK